MTCLAWVARLQSMGKQLNLGDTQKLGDEEKKLDNVIKFVIDGINQEEPVKRQEKADEQF